MSAEDEEELERLGDAARRGDVEELVEVAESVLRRVAESGDAEAVWSVARAMVYRARDSLDAPGMFRLGRGSEFQSGRALADARHWYTRAAQAGSVDAQLALVRLAVADHDYERACRLMSEAKRVFDGAPPRALVTVAEDVLCREVPWTSPWDRLTWAGEGGCERDAAFTVITPYPDRAARALLRVSPRFMDIDDDGREVPQHLRDAAARAGQYGDDQPYTPNFLHGVFRLEHGAQVALDTKGELTAAMGRTMVTIIVEALVADEVTALVAGACEDLKGERWERVSSDTDV